MDLIYTNPEKEDIGVLFDYEFDLAFGDDENDFECTIQLEKHCMGAGSYLYIEGTEYGGIVDSIKIDTEKQTVTYCGRTWHGILASSVIEPDPGYDYFVVNGDANTIFAALIQRLGLSSIFTANSEESGIQVKGYAFNRYTDAYSGIKAMLAENGGKLKFAYKTDTVILSAVYLTDYSKDDEWDASQVDFTIKKYFKPVNHLICLGTGNLKNRFVIHLFADENGGIQEFKKVENPVCDADYILDKSKQVLFGVHEVTAIYDYSSAQTAENFIKLTTQPDDWASNYASYFKQDDSDNYVSVEGVQEEQATALTEQPSDWATKYGKYYALVDGKYKTVEAVTTDDHRLQTSKPADWETNYGNYYTYFTDGVTDQWNKVSSVTATRFNVQTKRPSDWDTNYTHYYMRGRGFVSVEPDSYWSKKKKAYVDRAPTWKPNRYYTAENYGVAPEWTSRKYYTLVSTTGAPAFEPGAYYIVQQVIVNPPFASGKYFEKKLDHYAELVSGGVEKLKEYNSKNSISIDLSLEGSFDIGDIVGATEHTTGIEVWQPITKKIVTITSDKETINYEIGVK